MAYENNNLGEEIRFDQEITAEVSDEYEPLPEGEYSFTAVYKSQSRFNGSAKLGPCNVINVDVMVEGVTIPHRFYMNTKAVKWAFGLNAFFIALGLATPGGRFRPDWNAVPGRTGRCMLGIRTWTGNDGKEHKSNEIKSFLEPSANAAPAPAQSYQAPAQQPASAPQQTYQPQQQTVGGWTAGKF